MKKLFILLIVLLAGIAVISWGPRGHRTVALIAQKHLAANVKSAVVTYLQGENIEAAATWPDEHRTAQNAQWHFVDLPQGLNFQSFQNYVRSSKNTLYTAYLQSLATLQNNSSSISQKQDALRFLIHLVGDAHQPMHVARHSDKGGNDIIVRMDGESTNLHAIWDSRLLDHEKYSEAEMVAKYDVATPQEITAWQKDDIIQWLWESYQLSNQIYSETRSGQTISNAYYQKYISIIHKRINQAGIRLAGVLNTLYINAPLQKLPVNPGRTTPVQKEGPVRITLTEVNNNIGKVVTVSGKVYDIKNAGSVLLVNLGGFHPHQLLTLAIKGAAKQTVTVKQNAVVTVTGKIILFKAKPEIVITDASQLQ
ncbi:S1/P1 Nuclease [Filimonas lacunae]|uniref:S1/P1 Nuclease n=1 Tax=Filimonas lacunae TaxID=477680 RepID=A0A173MIH9_9BACT|nr:S1/P1 nuclease [Filimonas lacunae]BAV07442.1 endonuclease [Filimonas lacunae]SIT30357.1 S1/P1 Nuclease [Filimonas lacunae]